MMTPESIIDYNMDTGERTLLKQREVVGGYNQDAYRDETRYATSKDGQRIPIYLVYRKDLKKDGAQPLLLYSYGSYGSTEDPCRRCKSTDTYNTQYQIRNCNKLGSRHHICETG